jgi:ABC-type transporter Mla subunit MlaD
MIKKFSLIEFIVWIIIFCIAVGAVRIWRYERYRETRTYQIFLQDADGLMTGSPVKYSGVQVGYIDTLKILSNEVYIRFRITDKNFSVPEGSIATVEFSGLGGSKSLELYPPTEQSLASKNIIYVKNPKRINEGFGLLDEMYKKVDSITTRVSFFANDMKNTEKLEIIKENKNGKSKH